MIKKIICLALISNLIIIPSFANDMDTTSSWSELSKVENAWDGQKNITNKEYKQVIDALEKKKGINGYAKKELKGNELNTQDSGNFLNAFKEEFPLLNLTLPVTLPDGTVLPIGHYKIVGTRENNQVVLNFCQAHSVIGKLIAYETDDDFGEAEINFAKYEPYKDNYLRLMYGSMKFNAYSYLSY